MNHIAFKLTAIAAPSGRPCPAQEGFAMAWEFSVHGLHRKGKLTETDSEHTCKCVSVHTHTHTHIQSITPDSGAC